MKTCYIIGGGSYDGFFDKKEKEDMLIAADRGYKLIEKENIEVDLSLIHI